MKYLFFILLSFNLSFSQIERKYEFSTIEFKQNGKWECIDRGGDVIFFENLELETISIISNGIYREFIVIHKMMYTKLNSLAYVLEEEDGLKSSIKVVYTKESQNLELYFYSDRQYEKHLKINLIPCK
jgi:hypothetical protein